MLFTAVPDIEAYGGAFLRRFATLWSEEEHKLLDLVDNSDPDPNSSAKRITRDEPPAPMESQPVTSSPPPVAVNAPFSVSVELANNHQDTAKDLSTLNLAAVEPLTATIASRSFDNDESLVNDKWDHYIKRNGKKLLKTLESVALIGDWIRTHCPANGDPVEVLGLPRGLHPLHLTNSADKQAANSLVAGAAGVESSSDPLSHNTITDDMVVDIDDNINTNNNKLAVGDPPSALDAVSDVVAAASTANDQVTYG